MALAIIFLLALEPMTLTTDSTAARMEVWMAVEVLELFFLLVLALHGLVDHVLDFGRLDGVPPFSYSPDTRFRKR